MYQRFIARREPSKKVIHQYGAFQWNWSSYFYLLPQWVREAALDGGSVSVKPHVDWSLRKYNFKLIITSFPIPRQADGRRHRHGAHPPELLLGLPPDGAPGLLVGLPDVLDLLQRQAGRLGHQRHRVHQRDQHHRREHQEQARATDGRFQQGGALLASAKAAIGCRFPSSCITVVKISSGYTRKVARIWSTVPTGCLGAFK